MKKENTFNPILFKLIANNNIVKLEHTLKFNKEIDINQQDIDGDTPLHIAVFLCNIDAIKILSKYNVNLLITDKWGQIPLHRICFCMNLPAVFELINFFIKINKKNNLKIFNIQDNYGNTPLHLILKHFYKNNTLLTKFHIKLINKIKIVTDNNLSNIDNQSINNLLILLNF